MNRLNATNGYVSLDGSAPSLDDPRVMRAVEEYAERLSAGDAPDRAAFLARHADIADVLARCLDGLELVHAGGRDLSGPAAAASLADDLLSGAPLGDFRLIRELGRGGMGIVYEAEQLSLGRSVALKVLPYAATMDGKQLQRFKNEARAAASLHHENIVPVYGVGCERGVHYYAMQLIDGRSLADVIDELRQGLPSSSNGSHGALGTAGAAGAAGASGHLAPTAPVAAQATRKSGPDKAHYRRVAELVAKAADALEYAHSMGVVHRDVKPANLLLDTDGHLWVTDFGLAKLDTAANLTVSGDLVGTLRYMSPEQALAKHGLVDHRTDVYSLGATLYELLVLRPAVGGEDKQEILRRIAFEEPTPLRKFDKAIPTELETVTLKALAKNPTERYASAGEFADDLRRWLDDQAIKAKPPGIRERVVRWARRHQYVVRSAFAVVAMATVALATSTAMIYREKQRTQKALTQSRKVLDEVFSGVIEDWLAKQRVLTSDQKAFLQRGLEYYAEFASQTGRDAETRGAIAKAQRSVGTIRSLLGQTAEAEQAFLRSRDSFGSLLAEYPAAANYKHELAMTLSDFSTLLNKTGRRDEAMAATRRAIELDQQVAETFPEATHYRTSLALAWNNLGANLNEAGRYKDAEGAFRRSIALRRTVTAQHPEVPEHRHQLTMGLINLGIVLKQSNELGPAVVSFREAVATQRPLVDDRAAEVPAAHRELLGVAHHRLGHALTELGLRDEAEEQLLKAVAQQTILADQFPSVPGHRSELARSYSDLADVLAQTPRLDEAERLERKALALRRTLADRYPAVPQYRFDVAYSWFSLALLLGKTGRLSDIEQSYREAVPILERLAAADNGNRNHLFLLSKCRVNLANALESMGRLKEAEERYRQALPPLRKLAESGSADTCGDLANCCVGLANLLHETARRDEAKPLYEEFIALRQRAAAAATDSYLEQMRLATIYEDCAAREFWDLPRALAGAKRAIELAPKVADCWYSLGIAEYRAGHWTDAHAALQKALALRPPETGESFYVAMTLWHLGDHKLAQHHYSQALESARKHRPAAESALGQLRAEAAHVLRVTDAPKPPTGPQPDP